MNGIGKNMDANNFYIKGKEYIMNMPRKTVFIIVAIVLLIVLGIASYFYWINSNKKPVVQGSLDVGGTAEDITNSATKGVLPSLQNNPLQDNPDINPASNANPIKNIKTNPF